MKIGFIGCGNMGKAIVEGAISNKFSHELYVYDHNLNDESLWVKQTGIKLLTSEREIAENCDYIILAVKPYHIDNVLKKIATSLDEKKVLISLAASISIDDISQHVPLKQPIVRIMPNTAAAVCASMSAVIINKYVDDDKLKFIIEFCESFGKAELINEDLINAFIAICGSSPAYYYEILEGMGMAGIKMGMKADMAYRLAAQAMLGSAMTYLEKQTHPAILRDQVCSPKGTTIEAVEVLEKNGVKGSIMEAVIACYNSAKK